MSELEKKSRKTKHGGPRRGSGRPKGQPNKRTRALQKAVEESGITPLDFMLDVMRGKYPEGADPATIIAWEAMRMDAAKAAAPYVHPKLAPIDKNSGKTAGFVVLLPTDEGS